MITKYVLKNIDFSPSKQKGVCVVGSSYYGMAVGDYKSKPLVIAALPLKYVRHGLLTDVFSVMIVPKAARAEETAPYVMIHME